MHDGQMIDMTVKFEVAEYKTGQVQIRPKMLKAIKNRRKNLITFNGLAKVLSLDNLAKDPELNEIVINLGCNATMAMLGILLKANMVDVFKDINGLLLSNNGIRHFSSFKNWSKHYMQLVDISNNEVGTEISLFYVFIYFEYCLD